LAEELSPVREASRLKLADVRATLQKLNADANELSKAAHLTVSGGDEGEESLARAADDPFGRTMALFAETAAADAARLTKRLGELDEAYVSLLSWLRMTKPGGGGAKPPIETDAFFTMWAEFAQMVRLAIPKPKPPPPRQATSRDRSASQQQQQPPQQQQQPGRGGKELASTKGRGGTGSIPDDARRDRPNAAAPPLDPMLSRLRGVSAAPDREPRAAATGTGGAAASATTTGEDAKSAQQGGTGVAQGPARSPAQQSQAQGAKARAVDRKMQERLAARFERAQAKAAGR
jgi:hypothetical protein